MQTLSVPHAAASAATVRRSVDADLRAAGVQGEVLADIALVLTELVGNAVRHGAPLPGDGVRVVWEVRGSVVHVGVQDGGAGRPAPRGASLDAEGGRGLGIVSAVCLEWGVEPRGEGVVVWAQVALAGSAA